MDYCVPHFALHCGLVRWLFSNGQIWEITKYRCPKISAWAIRFWIEGRGLRASLCGKGGKNWRVDQRSLINELSKNFEFSVLWCSLSPRCRQRGCFLSQAPFFRRHLQTDCCSIARCYSLTSNLRRRRVPCCYLEAQDGNIFPLGI